MIHFGLLGCGYWGPNIVRVLLRQEDVRLVRVAEPREGRRERLLREHPGLQVCRDHREVIEDPILDAVVIATPVSTHHALAMEALGAGLHVLVEKPLASSTTEARALAAEAKRRGSVLMAGHIFQYSPAVEALARLCSGDGLGAIYYLDAARMNMGPPRSEVDVVWDLGPHDVSIVCHLLGTGALEVGASGASYARGGLIDTAFITVRYPGGIQAKLHLSWLSPFKVRRLHVAGRGGAVLYDETEPVEKVRFYHQGVDTRLGAGDADSVRLVYGPGKVTTPPLGTWEPLEKEIRHFIECIQRDREPVSGPAVAVKVVEILEAASRSIAQGGAVQRIDTREEATWMI